VNWVNDGQLQRTFDSAPVIDTASLSITTVLASSA